MRKLSRLIVVFAALALMGQGCKTDYFDRDFVDTVLHLSFHNDVVDPNHTWTLINEGVMQVVVDVPDVAQVMLLSATPLGNAKAEILASAEVMVGSPSRFSLHYALPLIQDKLYVGATMTDGSHLLGEIDRSKFSINVSSLQSVSESTWNEPSMQEVYYCYCNGYPQPSSSWDFNDLVLRIGRTLVDDYTIRLHVTLVAVGTKVQQAAAIRLYGVPYDEVESVTPVNNKRFVDNTSLVRSLIREDDDLLESRKGEAVINLFDDAHAAFYSKTDELGMVRRYLYNVTPNTDASHFTMTPRPSAMMYASRRRARQKISLSPCLTPSLYITTTVASGKYINILISLTRSSMSIIVEAPRATTQAIPGHWRFPIHGLPIPVKMFPWAATRRVRSMVLMGSITTLSDSGRPTVTTRETGIFILKLIW